MFFETETRTISRQNTPFSSYLYKSNKMNKADSFYTRISCIYTTHLGGKEYMMK